MKTQK
jgi:hypothetical protein